MQSLEHESKYGPIPFSVLMFIMLFLLIFLWVGIMIGIQRAHDIGSQKYASSYVKLSIIWAIILGIAILGSMTKLGSMNDPLIVKKSPVAYTETIPKNSDKRSINSYEGAIPVPGSHEEGGAISRIEQDNLHPSDISASQMDESSAYNSKTSTNNNKNSNRNDQMASILSVISASLIILMLLFFWISYIRLDILLIFKKGTK